MSVTSYYFLVLDIETSTLFNDKKEPTATWLSYGYCNLYDRDGNNKINTYFRKWEQLDKFLSQMSRRYHGMDIVCYVHNLAYEFDYLIKNVSKPKKFLTNSSHAIISCILEKYPNIQFRCSMRLVMKSLRELGREIGFDKLDSDYRFILPSDEVTEEEKQYCLRDCDVVARYVADYLLKEYQDFTKIPLTKTGRVRKVYKEFYRAYAKSNEVDWDLYPNEDCYEALNNAFSGGITISNPMFTGMVVKDVVSYDITSSYPFAQLSEEFPYTIEREYNISPDMLKEKFWIAKIEFKDIQTRYDWAWLSISKMNDYDKLNSVWFNGKLIHSKSVIRTITNVDYEIICKTYSFSSIDIKEFYHCYKYGELPKPYIDTIDTYAKEKYRLKKEVKKYSETDEDYLKVNMEYMLAKGDFNSIYGMSVQKILQEEYEITENYNWVLKDNKYKKKDTHMQRNFLFGVYTTAYARRNLINAILVNCPITFVYADTDSIKYIKGDKEFIDTNKTLPPKYLEKDYLAKLGRFDLDAQYTQFVTYGAKKYCYTHEDLNKVFMTVAGLPKVKRDDLRMYHLPNKYPFKYGVENESYYLLHIEDFKLNTLFRNCKLGKKYMTNTVTYDSEDLEEIYNVKEVDESTLRYLSQNHIKTGGGVALYPTSYLLDITNEDKFYLKEIRKGYDIWIKAMEKRTSIPLTKYLNMMFPID